MKHEVLSPAGSLEICRAVIDAGADAVYLGGEKYGARAFAKNFSQDGKTLLVRGQPVFAYGRADSEAV